MYRRLQALFSFSKMVAGDFVWPLQLNCLGCCVLVVLPSYPVCPAKIFTTVGNYRWRYVTCTRWWQGEINNVCDNDYADVVPHFNRLSPNNYILYLILSIHFPAGTLWCCFPCGCLKWLHPCDPGKPIRVIPKPREDPGFSPVMKTGCTFRQPPFPNQYVPTKTQLVYQPAINVWELQRVLGMAGGSGGDFKTCFYVRILLKDYQKTWLLKGIWFRWVTLWYNFPNNEI